MAKAKWGNMSNTNNLDAANKPTVLVCTNCKGQTPATIEGEPLAGTRLADAIAAAADPAQIKVLSIRCLANCSRGPSVAITYAGHWSYIFGNINPDTDADAVLEGARLLATSTDGLMPWRGRPDCLKRGLIARLPSPDFNGEPL